MGVPEKKAKIEMDSGTGQSSQSTDSKTNKVTGKSKPVHVSPGREDFQGPGGTLTSRWSHKQQGYQVTPTGSLLQEVLNEKKLALMKSADVVQYLQNAQGDIEKKGGPPEPSCLTPLPSSSRRRRSSGLSRMTPRPPPFSATVTTARHPLAPSASGGMDDKGKSKAVTSTSPSSISHSAANKNQPGKGATTRSATESEKNRKSNTDITGVNIKPEKQSDLALSDNPDIWSKGESAFTNVQTNTNKS